MIVNRKKFTESLKIACTVAEPRTTLPILSAVKINPNEGIIATDLDRWFIDRVPFTLDENEPAETICVHGKKLLEVIQSLPSAIEAVDIKIFRETGKENLPPHLMIHGTELTNLMDPAEFPDVPNLTGLLAKSIELKVENLWGMVKQVIPAAGENDARYILNGICIDLQEGNVVATDGHRLHVARFQSKQNNIEPIIIPRTLFDPALRLEQPGNIFLVTEAVGSSKKPKEGEEAVQRYRIKQVILSWDSRIITGRTMEGNYPNYKQVIPKSFERAHPIVIGDLRQKIKQAWPIVPEKINGAKFRFEGPDLSLHAINKEIGLFDSKKPQSKEENAFEIGFNMKYIEDAINAMHSEQSIFHLTHDTGPAKFVPVGQEEQFFAVVMPMRV